MEHLSSSRDLKFVMRYDESITNLRFFEFGYSFFSNSKIANVSQKPRPGRTLDKILIRLC